MRRVDILPILSERDHIVVLVEDRGAVVSMLSVDSRRVVDRPAQGIRDPEPDGVASVEQQSVAVRIDGGILAIADLSEGDFRAFVHPVQVIGAERGFLLSERKIQIGGVGIEIERVLNSERTAAVDITGNLAVAVIRICCTDAAVVELIRGMRSQNRTAEQNASQNPANLHSLKSEQNCVTFS